jgi:SAM-dependent methyltransferase
MRLSQLDKLIGALPGAPSSFLEIGPGMGDVSDHLMHRFPGIRGHVTDISQNSIEIVQGRLSGSDGLEFSTSDFTQLTDSSAFDLVVACEVFEHIEDDDAAFRAVHRLLAPGGHLLFSVPAFMSKWGPADEYGGHVRRYENQELRQKFEEHGFDVTHFWTYGFPLTNIISPVSRLYYRSAQKSEPLNQEHATKRSGTERSVASRLRRLPYKQLMAPFFLLQHLFRERDVGDGYVVLARKNQ